MSLPMKKRLLLFGSILVATAGFSVAVSVLFYNNCTSEAFRLRAKAVHGNPAAMRELGYRLQGTGTYPEHKEGTEWLVKAAEKGDTQAMCFLGLQYDSPPGTDPRALSWYRKGAEAGDPFCMGKLGEAYLYRQFGLREDREKSRKWYARADAIDRQRRGINK